MTSGDGQERNGTDSFPGVIALHAAEDGLLARVRVPGGRLRAAQLQVLAAAAQELGNGLVDITARANLQLHGLRHGSEAELLARLQAGGLLPTPSHDRVRNVLASPLGGRCPDSLDDVDGVVELLDARLRADPALAGLPGRFCFLVDDGTGAGTDLDPDITVMACRGDGCWWVLLDGQPLAFEGCSDDAVAMALRAATAFLAVRGDAWRMWETPGGVASVALRLGLGRASGRPRRRHAAPLRPGVLHQRDGRVAVTGLAPFGQLWPQLLRSLAELGRDVRLAAGRTVTIVDLDGKAGEAARTAMAGAGLILDEHSGWTGLTACAGTGMCSRALGDVRAAGTLRALARSADAEPEHWSACERRCGETREIPLTVAVQETGEIAVRSGAHTWSVATLREAGDRLLAETAAG